MVASLLSALPGSVAQGLIWGILAIGVYITYKVLDFADLTVDGSFALGGSVCAAMVVDLSLIHILGGGAETGIFCSVFIFHRSFPCDVHEKPQKEGGR